MIATLVQIDAWAGATATPLRVASHDDETLCHLDGQVWWPAIAQLPTLRRDLFDGSFDAGSISSPSGDLTLSIDAVPGLPALALHDTRVRVWRGTLGAGFDAFELVFDGRVKEQPAIKEGLARLSIAVDDSWLDQPLLATYAGTGGAEGPAAMQGQVKPLALGAPRFAPATLIDAIDNIYQISAYGPMQAVETAFERLSRFGAATGDASNFASLKAADIPAGRWATCLAGGYVRLGAPSEGLLSFHVRGDAQGGWSRLPGDFIARIATIAGGAGRFAAGDVGALNIARPWPLSIMITDQTTARDLIQRIAASVNAVAYVDWLGVLRVAPVGIDTASLTMAADGSALPPVASIGQIAIAAPYWKIAQGAATTWQVHALSDIAFTAPLNPRGPYDNAESYREGDIVTLANGSQWLFVGVTPLTGSAPDDANINWFRLSGDITAGNITYEDGTSVEALKPAEPGATVGATAAEKGQIAQLESETAAAQAAIAQAQADIAEITGAVEGDFGPIMTAINDLENEVAVVQSDITALQSASSAVQTSVGALQTDLATAQQTIGTITLDVAGIEQSVSALQASTAQQIGVLNTDVAAIETQAAGIISSIGAIGTTVDQIETTVATQGGSINTLAQSVSNVEGSVSTLSSTVSAQGSSISTIQQAVATAEGDLATLTTKVSAGGGNLLQNTDLAVDTNSWAFHYAGQLVTPGRNAPSSEWQVAGENILSMHQDGAASSYANWSQSVAVAPSSWYELSALAAAHRCRAQLIIQWLDVNGNETGFTQYSPETIVGSGGPSIGGWTPLAIKGFSPANVVRALVYLRKLGTIEGQGYVDSWAWFCRPQMADTRAATASPLAYSPGSARAAISVQTTAIDSLNGSMATLTTRVATAESSITTNAQAITGAQGSIASLSTTVASQGGSISSLQSVTSNQGGTIAQIQTDLSTANASISQNATAISTTNGNLASLSSTVSSQGSSIGTLQSAVSTAQGNIATLTTQVSAGGGNLLQNTDIIDLSYWTFGSNNSGAGYRVAASGAWVLTDENALHIAQDDGGTSGFAEWSQWVAIQADRWYDTSVLAAAHRCNVEVYLQWHDAGGSSISAPSTGQTAAGIGTADLRNWSHFGFKAQAPSNAVRARIILRKFATYAGAPEPSSYAWFCRPQVKETLAGASSPLAYGVGSARGVVQIQAQALSTLGTSFASLETRVSSAEGSVTSLSQSLTSANGSISSLQTSVSSLNGSVTTLQQSSSTQAGQISSLQSSVNTQGASISTNAQAITGLQGSVSSLNTIVAASSSPNLCPNGGFENGLRGWTGGGVNGTGWGHNTWVWGNWAGNGIGFTGNSAGAGNFAYMTTDGLGVAGDGNGYALSFDYDMQGGAGCVCYGEVNWHNSSGQLISQSGTPQGGPKSFDTTGNSRSKGYMVAPSGAATARISVVFYAPNGVTIAGINFRQVKFEFGNVATPYSGEATARQMFTAYSDLNSSHASLSSTVSSQSGSISTLQSTTSTLSGSVSSLSTTVTAQGGSITSLQSVQSTQSGQIATLNSRVTLGGNLLQNTEFAVSADGWAVYIYGGNPATYAWGRDLAGDSWRPTNEHILGLQQLDANSGNAAQWFSSTVPVIGNRWYEGAVHSSSHRAYTSVRLDWYDGNGAGLGSSESARSDSFPGFYQSNGGNNLGAWQRLWVKAQAPANAARALIVLLKHGTSQDGGWNGATDSYAWFCRPQLAEVYAETQGPTAYSPGLTGVVLSSQATAINTLTGQYASLSSTVATQGSSISTNATAISTLNGTVASLSSTVSSQGGSISTLQSTTSTLQGNVASLTTRVQAGGGYNLIKNGGFENGLADWDTQSGWGWSSGSNWGSYAYANIAGSFDGYRYIDSPRFNVDATGLFTAGFDFDITTANNAGFDVWSEILWFGSNGIEVSRSGGPHVYGNGSRGFWYSNSDGSNRRDTANTATAPTNAVQALVRLVAYSTQMVGFAVRQVKMERGTIATAYTADASIVQSFQTLSTLNTQYASLSSTVSALNASVTVQQTAITTLEGRTAAFFQVESVTPGGRAQLRVYSFANGGAGVDIIGDLGVSGNGIFGGTINPEALALQRFVKKINGGGSGTPSAGQNLLLYSVDMGQTLPNGVYSIDFSGILQTNVGRQTTSIGSKPSYVNVLADGGIRLLITKNGVTIVDQIYTAQEWANTNNIALRETSFSIVKIIDPDNDTATGNAIASIYAVRGTVDTGTVDNGDYYQRDVSAEYAGVSANAKVRWTFI